MQSFSLAFLLGVLLLQQFTFLPTTKWIWILLFFSTTVFILNKRLLIISASALGFMWALWFAHHQTSWTLSHELEGKDLIIRGYISSIPDSAQFGQNFLFATRIINGARVKTFLHLTWQNKFVHLHVGEEWQFTVHLKKIHSTMNPGGFDYEAFALYQGLRANGYIINKAKNKLLSNHWYHGSLDRIRQNLKEKIEKNLPLSNTSQWITALVTGERRGINQEKWRVLRNTGTNHLMAIAGLHIGFMAAFTFIVVGWCWRRIPTLTIKIPSQIAGSVAALLMALTYSSLAGFSIPTQRACLMLSIILVMTLLRRNIFSWYTWSLALCIMLLLNPLSVLNESFWLSFGSVALIIYGVSARLNPGNLWWKWGRIQWVIGLGLIPFSVWLFHQFSIVSFVANSIAIPWVGFLLVPLCLLGSFTLIFSEKMAGIILLLADKNLDVLWGILTWLSQLSWASWYQTIPNHWVLIAACLGVVILLIPVGFPGRWFGIMWMLPLFLYHPAKPKLGEAWFTLLDVGQGLSAVVQTQQHLLVFDSGAKLSVSFDMGESVVVPFLHTLGAKNLDMLVISHGDNDHSGGALAILEQFPVAAIKTSVTEKTSQKNVSYCLRGEKWIWDGVYFEFLYPSPTELNLDNDSSCVLKVTAKNKSFLLTGDIEKYAEKYLLANEVDKLASDVLIAPHHGSKTSAVDGFLQAVKPQMVLFAVGYRNRYHFPNRLVIEKYNMMHVKQYDSVHAGAIIFSPELSLYRQSHSHYWNE